MFWLGLLCGAGGALLFVLALALARVAAQGDEELGYKERRR